MMMKKKTVIAVLILCIAIGLLFVAPVYSARLKRAPTYTDLQAEFEEKGLFLPTEDALPFTVEQVGYVMAGSNSDVGHIVNGKLHYQDTAINCGIWLYSPDEDGNRNGYPLYPGVECKQYSAGEFRLTEVAFSYGEQSFRIVADYPVDTPDEVTKYLKETLLESAESILRQFDIAAGNFISLPTELTAHWVIEETDGTATSQAAIPRGDKWYQLTEGEYRQILAGADPDEVLAARWEWYVPTAPYSMAMQNTAVYTYKAPADMAPADAALACAELFMNDLQAESSARTFTIEQYRDLSVELMPTADMDTKAAEDYFLQAEEISEHTWIVKMVVEFRYSGTYSPLGELPEGTWTDLLHQGSPIGFLLRQEGNTFTMRSRYDTANGD